MEISLVQPNVSLVKLAFSSRGIVLLLFLYTFQLTFALSTARQQQAFGYHKINILLENAYIQVTIFHEHDLYVVYLFIIK